jgi:GxxExxY protein
MPSIPLYEEELTEAIIGAAIEVHRHLGPGLLESAYQICLAHEFHLRKIPYQQELTIPVTYKGLHLDANYRLDFLVDQKIVVELKAVEVVLPVHEAQLITYLQLTGCRAGLLINFNIDRLTKGIIRRAL